MIDVLIINYNTPELTEAALRSLWKHTPDARVTLFDNSDKLPFTHGSKFPDSNSSLFTYIDNTQGQIVEWEQWLGQFPDKQPSPENAWGSAKHCYSVELCFDRFPDGFILMDSDVLIKKDITPLCDPTQAYVGRISCNTRNFGFRIERICPFICWINTPLLHRYDIRYFNAEKMWKLHRWVKGSTARGCHDTGAWLLEECRNHRLPGRDIDINGYITHLRGGSWRGKSATEFLKENRNLWIETG